MINEKIYPKEHGEIQYGVRRIPLHYLPELEGGNKMLQYEILDLCQLTILYHKTKHDLNECGDKLYHIKFEEYKTRFKNNQEQIYQNLLDVVNNSDSKYKEQIRFELVNYHFDLIDLIESIEL